jgi:hypothetical protein
MPSQGHNSTTESNLRSETEMAATFSVRPNEHDGVIKPSNTAFLEVLR